MIIIFHVRGKKPLVKKKNCWRSHPQTHTSCPFDSGDESTLISAMEECIWKLKRKTSWGQVSAMYCIPSPILYNIKVDA